MRKNIHLFRISYICGQNETKEIMKQSWYSSEKYIDIYCI